MNETMEFLVRAALIGTGATVLLDAWAWLLKRLANMPAASYALVGRWMCHFPRGRFFHDNIAESAPMRGEALIGWTMHYCIGIAYAALLLAIAGLEWARAPSLLPALLLGWVTMAAPFLVMQPGMGAGVFASRTPNPAVARLRTVLAHTVFGAGLYLAALLLAAIIKG